MSTHFDGSLKFDTKIDTSGIITGLKKISELAKRGEQALAKLTLEGLKKSSEKTLAVLSKIASIGLGSLNASINTATAGLTALTGGMGALVGKSVEVGKDFESSMSQVLATMGKTKDSMATLNGQKVNIYDTLNQKAKELGASTQFSASEVADAFNYMALAGWGVEKQLGSIDGILDLSAASGLELGQTCDIVTDYLSAFGMTAEQSGQMADMMAYAQSNANLTVSALAESWKNCAANMNANGQSIETTTALLSKMADQGFKGSEAGTALTAIVRDMSNSMEDGAIKIGDTSVAVADAEGNYRDLTDILVDVDKAVGNLPETARTTALSTTFTADSIKGMNLLLNAGVYNIKEFEDNLSDMAVIEGFASKSAQTMNDNLEGDMKSLSSAAEGVQIAISDKLTPSLRELAQNGTTYLQQFNDALDSGDGAEGILAFASSIGDVLAESLKDNEEILQNATLIGSSFMNALIDGIRNNQDKIAQSITKSIQQGAFVGEKVFTNFYNLGLKLVSSVGDGLAENPDMFMNLTEDFLNNISSSFSRYSSKLVQSGTTILKAILQGISKSSKNVSKDITILINDVAKILGNEIPEFINIGTDIITGLITGITDGMAQSDVTAKDIIDSIAISLSKNRDRLLDSAWTLISALGKGIGENLPELAQYGLDIVLALTGFIGEHANEIADGALDLILALADTLITEDNLTRIGDTAIKLISNFATGLISGDNMTKISKTANNVVKAVADALLGEKGGDSGINDIVSAGTEVGGQLLGGFARALFDSENGIYAILNQLVHSIGEYLSENFWELGSMAIEGFLSGVSGIDFSLEEWDKYNHDTMQNGTFWSEYFDNANTMWNDIFSKGLGLNQLSASYRKGYTDVNGNPIDGWELTENGWQQNLSDNYKSLENAVNESNKSNSDTAMMYQTSINTQSENIGLLTDKFSQFLNQKQTIQVSLYENADSFAEVTATGVNLSNAKNGGY